MSYAYRVAPDLVDLGAATADDTADEVVGYLHLMYVMLYESARCSRVRTAAGRRWPSIATDA